MSISEQILAIYDRGGSGSYFGEPITQTEHGLQAAYFARCSGAPDPLVLAALLHDIGHLLEDVPEDIADWRVDAHHEAVGSRWLERRFGPAVAEPVRLHVPAKRYLCATDPGYHARLSAASVHTLGLQGGPMSAAELAIFEAESFWREAILLRQWDDQGKVQGLPTPDLTEYRELIEGLARPGVAS